MSDTKPMRINPPRPSSPTVKSPRVTNEKGDSLLDEALEMAGLSNSDGGGA